VYQNITTEQDLKTYISNTFPHFTSSDVNQLLSLYPANSGSSSGYLFATLGNSGPTAVTRKSINHSSTFLSRTKSSQYDHLL
jgi:hypothetical protein